MIICLIFFFLLYCDPSLHLSEVRPASDIMLDSQAGIRHNIGDLALHSDPQHLSWDARRVTTECYLGLLPCLPIDDNAVCYIYSM